MNGVYYNEIDAYCAQWLRNLIAAGHLPDGEVDERDIRQVEPGDIHGFTACHFFAGIGGWPLALQLAGWPADEPVWTGSCPCQPFSCAGKRAGTADERHLWPDFKRLIKALEPSTVFGEQVASKDGRQWLARVRIDLEALGYGVGAADLCAAGKGAPHIRQRLWWVADTGSMQRQWRKDQFRSIVSYSSERNEETVDYQRSGTTGRLVNPPVKQMGLARLPWEHFDVVNCLDGKARRVEPGSFPLAHGVPARVGKLRAYGNAIVPQVAAEFIQAYLACRTAE